MVEVSADSFIYCASLSFCFLLSAFCFLLFVSLKRSFEFHPHTCNDRQLCLPRPVRHLSTYMTQTRRGQKQKILLELDRMQNDAIIENLKRGRMYTVCLLRLRLRQVGREDLQQSPAHLTSLYSLQWAQHTLPGPLVVPVRDIRRMNNGSIETRLMVGVNDGQCWKSFRFVLLRNGKSNQQMRLPAISRPDIACNC
jgi:hypothetical protein